MWGHLYPVRDIESQYRTFRAGAGYLEPAQDIRYRCRSSKAGARHFRSVQEFQTGTGHLEVTQGSWRQHRSCRSSTGHFEAAWDISTQIGTFRPEQDIYNQRRTELVQDTWSRHKAFRLAQIRVGTGHTRAVRGNSRSHVAFKARTRAGTGHSEPDKTFKPAQTLGAVTGQPAQYTQSQYGTLIWHRTFRASTRPSD